MGAKRALIVDDSKSARVFLSRILEKYEIDVDSAENAEVAIEYLGSHRPDVIFMDHMMPGMDGFQAVQAIKNNPRTATIPIMMYTSQEGELYLGQARALGAVGVLPKQIKPADVSKVLYQLHLVQDRRTNEQSSFKPVTLEAVETSPDSAPPPASRLTDSSLRDLFAELRRALMASIDTQSERITSDVRLLIRDAQLSAPSSDRAAREGRAAWIIASLALTIALISGALWWREAKLRQDLVGELAAIKSAQAAAAANPVVTNGGATVAGGEDEAAAAAAASAAGGAQPGLTPDGKPMVVAVPYGEAALGGPRLEALRQILTRLAARNYAGVVEVRTFPGRFCLVGNATEGYSVAPDELAFSRCNSVGNPHEDALEPSQRESLGYANLVGEFRSDTRGALDVRLTQGDVATTVATYPVVAPTLTAGEWNKAAVANNRVEIRLR
jgi:CheY-like chemotaxis protein